MVSEIVASEYLQVPVEVVVFPEVLDNLDDLADVLVGRKFQRAYRHLSDGHTSGFEVGGGGSFV